MVSASSPMKDLLSFSSYFSISLTFFSAPTKRWKGKASGSTAEPVLARERRKAEHLSQAYKIACWGGEGGRRKGQGETIKIFHCLNLEEGGLSNS